MYKVFGILVFFLSLVFCGFSQGETDTLSGRLKNWPVNAQEILAKHHFIQANQTPVNLVIQERNSDNREYLFYILAGLFFTFGFLKVFYAKYFNNIFRLYFNTSLKHNQITDLLLQARLSSLLFNAFFFITAGVYLYFILNWYKALPALNPLLAISLCILFVTGVYILKYFGLRFMGWLSGLQSAASIYIFITFIINKILGVILLPFIAVIAFSDYPFAGIAVVLSLVLVGLLFLSRYFRSFGLLEKELRISLLHFVIYILAVEIIPLLLIWKGMEKSLQSFG